jgi:hypothetical protein
MLAESAVAEMVETMVEEMEVVMVVVVEEEEMEEAEVDEMVVVMVDEVTEEDETTTIIVEVDRETVAEVEVDNNHNHKYGISSIHNDNKNIILFVLPLLERNSDLLTSLPPPPPRDCSFFIKTKTKIESKKERHSKSSLNK